MVSVIRIIALWVYIGVQFFGETIAHVAYLGGPKSTKNTYFRILGSQELDNERQH